MLHEWLLQEPHPWPPPEDDDDLELWPTSGLLPDERKIIFQMRDTLAEPQSAQFVSVGSLIERSTVNVSRHS